MENKITKNTVTTLKAMLEMPAVKKNIDEMLKGRSSQFITSVLNLTNTSLQGCEPNSIYGAVMKSASLDLSVDPNLGQAWIIPYNNKNGKQAQFQIGYKGFIQLAKRSGQYLKLNAIPVYEGQLKSFNPLTEDIEMDWNNKESDKVIGFMAYIKEINGFEKTMYWTSEEMQEHALKYSKNYAKYKNGLWAEDFVKMGQKTALKLMLSKWGTLSIDMQTAINTDQAVINLNGDKEEIHYIDNEEEKEEAFDPFANAQVPDEVIDAEVTENVE